MKRIITLLLLALTLTGTANAGEPVTQLSVWIYRLGTKNIGVRMCADNHSPTELGCPSGTEWEVSITDTFDATASVESIYQKVRSDSQYVAEQAGGNHPFHSAYYPGVKDDYLQSLKKRFVQLDQSKH
jgi:hypothetical protein